MLDRIVNAVVFLRCATAVARARSVEEAQRLIAAA